MEDVFAYVKEAEKHEKETKEKKDAQAVANDLHLAIRLDLVKLHDSLEGHLKGIAATANGTLENTEKTLKMAEDLKGGTNDLLSKVGNVTSVADNIASTTQSYQDTLVARQTPTFKATADPKILGDIDRRAKQVLVDIFDKAGENTFDKSLGDLQSKANKILDKMTDADKPEKVKVETVLKTKKNAILLTLNSKEAATWIRDPGNEEAFANAFSKGVH